MTERYEARRGGWRTEEIRDQMCIAGDRKKQGI